MEPLGNAIQIYLALGKYELVSSMSVDEWFDEVYKM